MKGANNMNLIERWNNPRFPFEVEENERMAKELKKDVIYKDGVGIWKESKNCLPMDIAKLAQYLGYPIDLQKHERASNKQIHEFFVQYRKARENYILSEEEQTEMRAAFGEGVEVVNVVTGQKFFT